jgi:hypothetical protein
LKAAGKPNRSFEILNLGKCERQYFAGIDPALPDPERPVLSTQREDRCVPLILFAHNAEPVFQSPPFHGRKAEGGIRQAQRRARSPRVEWLACGPIGRPGWRQLLDAS